MSVTEGPAAELVGQAQTQIEGKVSDTAEKTGQAMEEAKAQLSPCTNTCSPCFFGWQCDTIRPRLHLKGPILHRRKLGRDWQAHGVCSEAPGLVVLFPFIISHSIAPHHVPCGSQRVGIPPVVDTQDG